VDDEPYILKILSFKLRVSGMVPFEAADGERALRVLREERPDLILLDVSTPHGLRDSIFSESLERTAERAAPRDHVDRSESSRGPFDGIRARRHGLHHKTLLDERTSSRRSTRPWPASKVESETESTQSRPRRPGPRTLSAGSLTSRRGIGTVDFQESPVGALSIPEVGIDAREVVLQPRRSPSRIP